MLGAIRKLVFGISAQDTSFERREFRGGSPAMRSRLEKIGKAFVDGYHAALDDHHLDALVPKLRQVDRDLEGFAFEGAAMGLALLDRLTPWWPNRLQAFLEGAGGDHAYMVHVGVGWVIARIPGNVERQLSRLDPLLRWLAMDGYGFHEGFFRWRQYLAGQPAPNRVQGYARRAFDQGLGRCLWFIDGGDVKRIPQTIGALAAPRRGDLWSGVGLASVYAGGVGAEELRNLRQAAGEFQPQLAQGAAFAAKARLRAGNATAYTGLASEILCGLTAEAAAEITNEILEDLSDDADEPAYEVWRKRVQERLKSVQA